MHCIWEIMRDVKQHRLRMLMTDKTCVMRLPALHQTSVRTNRLDCIVIGFVKKGMEEVFSRTDHKYSVCSL